MTAKIVSIAQAKGGVGKSTLCANLSVTLSQTGKVLMIDCDPPQNSLSHWYKVRDEIYVETGLSIEPASTPAQLTSIIDKNKSILDLEDKLKIKENIVYEPPYYFLITDEVKEGPYCQNCYDSQAKLIRLQEEGAKGYWRCFNCKFPVKDENFSPRGPVTITRY